MTKVLIWEMDSFSGRKLDEAKEFNTPAEAREFVTEFNSKNTGDKVPDWYMYASIEEF